jgi:hypothetical protein
MLCGLGQAEQALAEKEKAGAQHLTAAQQAQAEQAILKARHEQEIAKRQVRSRGIKGQFAAETKSRCCRWDWQSSRLGMSKSWPSVRCAATGWMIGQSKVAE